jgi:hypothetical protein
MYKGEGVVEVVNSDTSESDKRTTRDKTQGGRKRGVQTGSMARRRRSREGEESTIRRRG